MMEIKVEDAEIRGMNSIPIDPSEEPQEIRNDEKNFSKKRYRVKDAVSPLHPRRIISNETQKERNRFSNLLLEHGEKHIQDWAVIASSRIDASSDVDNYLANNIGNSNGHSTSNHHTPYMNFQGNHSSNNTDLNGKSKIKYDGNSPSTCMGHIEGRLRLCSRSIVFEPTDSSRGVIRCPFDRMETAPLHIRPLSQNTSSNAATSSGQICETPQSSSDTMNMIHNNQATNNAENGIVMKCSRHLVMKVNNVIGPFEVVPVPAVFKFIFLHSSPTLFLDLSTTLYQLESDERGTSKHKTLDQMLRPMFVRPFDPSNFVHIRENPCTSNLRCFLLEPLVSKPGCVLVTKERLYFQPADDIVSTVAPKAKNWDLNDIVGVARRYNGLKDSAVEIFLRDNTSALLAFESTRDREQVIHLLPSDIPCHTDKEFILRAMKEWQANEISNFEYLLALNSAAGRSYSDLSRYPVFPWVISDYKSEKLDLSSDSTFRDLTKPMGALDQKRLEYFRKRFDSMNDMEHQFLYGTHYSAPGYVLYYLIRRMPEHMLCLQNGKFEVPDRIFHDVDQCYKSVLSNPADVKELIPQFYDPSNFDFLINAQGLQLGSTQIGERVNDVVLPNWARSGRDFLKKNRKALESDFVNNYLPRWIDLIFGVKSRGDEAKEASNLFHRMAYMGPNDLKQMKTDEERSQAELQATEFGIVPDLLFTKMHPSKNETVQEDFFSKFESFIVETDRSMKMESMNEENENDYLAKVENLSSGDQQWEMLDSPSNCNDIDRNNGLTSSPTSQHVSSSTNYMSQSDFGAHTLLSTSGFRKFGDISTNSPGDNNDRSSWLKNFSNEDRQVNGKYPERSQDEVPLRERLSIPPMTNNSSKTTEELSSKAALSFQTSNPRVGRDGFHVKSDTNNSRNNGEKSLKSSPVDPDPMFESTTQIGWELKKLISKSVHGDSISGCYFLQEGEFSEKNSRDKYSLNFVTASLDGNLMIHYFLSRSDAQSRQPKRRPFSGARMAVMSRSSYNFTASSRSITNTPNTNSASLHPKLNTLRTHSSEDPVACVAVTGDGCGGNIVFVGGHDDVVVAYGINSACALASLYSHRDAVTGLELIPLSSFAYYSNIDNQRARDKISDSSTHVMISGSWDATVKLWSVSVAAGETVSINREPLVELFDAEAPIVCMKAVEVINVGIAICAGCADGSFVVWLFGNNGVKDVVYKHIPKKGSGPCADVEWAAKPNSSDYILFTGFGNGKISSYHFFSNGSECSLSCQAVSRASLGSPVRCLSTAVDDKFNLLLFAGCSDGGLRLLLVVDEGFFDESFGLWKSLNGPKSPSLSHILVDSSFLSMKEGNTSGCVLLCCTGAEDGSLVLFELIKKE